MVTSTETPQKTTGLDDALEALRTDMDDPKKQSSFYDLFLNSTFFVPTLDEKELAGDATPLQEGQVLPLIIESEGNDYLMLFDTKERMQAWSDAGVKWVDVPGHVLAATTMPPLHWALNVGTEHAKQFLPDEIAWLREVVERCNAAAEKDTSE
jgi:peptidyl-prolyl cis-trans isomerase C